MNALTANKDLKKLLKDAEGVGWVFTMNKAHIKGRHPNGQTTTISRTPSDWRVLKNIQRDLRIKNV
jgi:predicted RNA binding protein YcfA (HicA-like mRNA interferase family)